MAKSKFRVDGVLESIGDLSKGASTSIVSRIKVISNLLSYITDVPQEGRVVSEEHGKEIRVSTFPTLHGERVALRFFGLKNQYVHLDGLGHTADVIDPLYRALNETSGAIFVTGPAGSGKSTTLFACIRHLTNQSNGEKCIMTLEDPIEVPIEGVSQSQINLATGFDLPTGLRSILRQDPEIIMVGEVRDPATAEAAMQSSLTGQLLLSSFHANNAVASINRLIDLGVDPYMIRSGVNGILHQRLLRKLCDSCKQPIENSDQICGLSTTQGFVASGCDECDQKGFQGRVVVGEYLQIQGSDIIHDIGTQIDTRMLYKKAIDSGMATIWDKATCLVEEGQTSPYEVRRVLGVSAY